MRVRPLRTLVPLLVLSAVLPACQHAPPATTGGEGSLQTDTGQLFDFRPQETAIRVDDPRDVDLRALFEDLGPDVRTWYQHVQSLSSPYFEGRAGGTPGFVRATDYVRFFMDELDLVPAFRGADGPTYIQPFTYPRQDVTRQFTVRGGAFAIGDQSMTEGDDFVVLAPSAGERVTAPLTFVGYAIENGPGGYTSFRGDPDLSGRIAVVLQYEPLDADGSSRWAQRRFSPHARMDRKLASVAERGAAGVIVVAPPHARDGDAGLPSLEASAEWGDAHGIPMIQITPAAAGELLGASLDKWRSEVDLNRIFTYDVERTATIGGAVEITSGAATWPSSNVAGILPGKGALADEWIVIGGHYDHLGHGRPGSRHPEPHGHLHPGADDNASGTAGVLMIAEWLSAWSAEMGDDANHRSILFCGFGAEEAGLHGSRYLIDHAEDELGIDLADVTLMVNFDMIGRLRDNRCMVSGVGTATELRALLNRFVGPTGLRVMTTDGGQGPSDHANFYNAGIPVLFFFTGLHDDYHTPGDEGWTVNPVGAVRIIEFARPVIKAVATRTSALTFAKSDGRPPRRGDAAPTRTGASVRFGIMPDYGAEVDGVSVGGVSEGTSAANAGIQAGDILLTWNGEELTGGQSLARVLRESSVGDVVTVTLLRGGEVVSVDVTLQGR